MRTSTVVWDKMNSEAETATMTAKLNEMIAEGKSVGTVERTSVSESVTVETPARSIRREWTAVEHAQEWVDFILSYDPVSAVVDPE